MCWLTDITVIDIRIPIVTTADTMQGKINDIGTKEEIGTYMLCSLKTR